MAKLFLHVFNLSITASWLIAAVLLVRWIIKGKTPRWISCLLWAFVGLRLAIPFYFESDFSIIPSKETVIPEAIYGEVSVMEQDPETELQKELQTEEENPVIGGEISAPVDAEISFGEPTAIGDSENKNVETQPNLKEPTKYVHSGFETIDERINEAIHTAKTEEKGESNPVRNFANIASVVWLCGVVLMLVYAVVNYLLLKKRVSVFVPENGNIRRSENVGSPFILGFVRPKIYLPFGLSKETETHIIAHELAHLNRRDHWIKPLGFAFLSVYWFNPLVWVAYVLLCRDIEYACDEKVVKEMSEDARKSYATALLECGVKRNIIAACPVAFGEIGVKDRVKTALNYKKPIIWIIIAAVIVSAVTAGVFLLAPKNEEDASSADESSKEVSEESSREVSDESREESEDGFDASGENSDETLGNESDEGKKPITGNLNHKKYVFKTELKDKNFNENETPHYIIESNDGFKTFYNENLFDRSVELEAFAKQLNEDYFENKSLVVARVTTSDIAADYSIDRLYREENTIFFDVSYKFPERVLLNAQVSVIVVAEVEKLAVADVSKVQVKIQHIESFVPAIWDGSAAEGFESGEGTQNSPYIIKTAEQLAYLAKTVNDGNDYSGKYIALSADIKLNDADSGRAWTPIGYMIVSFPKTDYKPFKGVFDGRNHSVSGMIIENTKNNIGLFGYAESAVIKNVTVEGRITGSSCVGALAGNAASTSFENCTSSGTVNGTEGVGGIVGMSVRGSIKNCRNYSAVSGQKRVGGIVGYNSGDETLNYVLKNCYNTGAVTASLSDAGGIAGAVSGVMTTKCYNSGNVNGNTSVGGIVGTINREMIDCYNLGLIKGNRCVGGIAGVASGGISRCFNNAKVIGNEGAGGICGAKHHYIALEQNDCYYLKDGGLPGIGGLWTHSDGTEGNVSAYENKPGESNALTADQMKKQESFVGFDFANVWKMGNNNPIFK